MSVDAPEGVDEVIAYLSGAIAELQAGEPFDLLSAGRVLGVLRRAHAGLVDRPEWSQVTEAKLRGELERARSMAVRLEQELHEATLGITRAAL